MNPLIKISPERLLVGHCITTTLAQKKTLELWKGFMPRRNEIKNTLNKNLFSVEIYDPKIEFNNFNQYTTFEKWAAVEVSDHQSIPSGLEALMIPSGLYAVFIHKGPASEGGRTFNFIFKEWLPASEYLLDQRPHFEIMGEKYKNDDPESEEEVWVPVRKKINQAAE